MSSVAIIVKSGSGAMRVQAKSLLAIVDRRGMTIGMRPGELPPWYDIVPAIDLCALLMTRGVGDAVSTNDSMTLIETKSIGDAATATDALATTSSLSSTLSDSVTVGELFVGAIVSRTPRYVGASHIGATSIG